MIANDDDVVAHRPGGVEHEKREAPVAGNQTELLCHLCLLWPALCICAFCGLLFGAVVGLLPAAAQDHAARGGADEVDEVGDFRTRERRVLLDAAERLRRVELRLRQVAVAARSFLSVSSVKPRRISPIRFRPNTRAGRLPTVRPYGSASLVTTE